MIFYNFCGNCSAPRPPVIKTTIDIPPTFYQVPINRPTGNCLSKLSDADWYFFNKEFEGKKAKITRQLINNTVCIVLPNKEKLFSENAGLSKELERLSVRHSNHKLEVFVVCERGTTIYSSIRTQLEKYVYNFNLTRITID